MKDEILKEMIKECGNIDMNQKTDLENKDIIILPIISKYGNGVINPTNNIWCLVYEITVQEYEDWFGKILRISDKNAKVLVYFDIENGQRHIVVNKVEQENFESTHNVIDRNLPVEDGYGHYYSAKRDFFESCLKEGQDAAVQKILAKCYKNKKRK